MPVSSAARLAWAVGVVVALSTAALAEETTPPVPPQPAAASAPAPQPAARPDTSDAVRVRTPGSPSSPGPDGRPLGWTLCACVGLGKLV
jgi:hypothetical protein